LEKDELQTITIIAFLSVAAIQIANSCEGACRKSSEGGIQYDQS
jgi:hypothetical protein